MTATKTNSTVSKSTATHFSASCPDGTTLTGPIANENAVGALGRLAGQAAGAVAKALARESATVGGWVKVTYFDPSVTA